MYFELKEYIKAIKDYNKSIDISPLYPNAFYNRDLAYLDSGNINFASEDWKKAYELGFEDAFDLLYQYCK